MNGGKEGKGNVGRRQMDWPGLDLAYEEAEVLGLLLGSLNVLQQLCK